MDFRRRSIHCVQIPVRLFQQPASAPQAGAKLVGHPPHPAAVVGKPAPLPQPWRFRLRRATAGQALLPLQVVGQLPAGRPVTPAVGAFPQMMSRRRPRLRVMAASHRQAFPRTGTVLELAAGTDCATCRMETLQVPPGGGQPVRKRLRVPALRSKVSARPVRSSGPDRALARGR
jgi:hypothetical protein